MEYQSKSTPSKDLLERRYISYENFGKGNEKDEIISWKSNLALEVAMSIKTSKNTALSYIY